MELLYQDSQIVLCVKSVGLSSEAGPGSLPALLENQLGGPVYPVHRLDLNVGGVMVYARTHGAASALSRAVQAGELQKEYLALIHGCPNPPAGTWEDLLWKDSAKKPHGALYNMAVKDAAISDAVCEGIAAVNPHLILLGPARSQLTMSAKRYGLPAAKEVFADRAYEEDGTLVPRSRPGSVILDEAAAVSRVIQMVKKGTVTAITGKEIEVEADSICVHGDSPAALAFVRSIHTALSAEGIRIVPMHQFVA